MPTEPGLRARGGSGFDDVQERNAQPAREDVLHAMERVRHAQDHVRPRTLECVRAIREVFARLIPLRVADPPLREREIHRAHDHFGRVPAAEPLVHGRVQAAVVVGRGLVAGAAEDADALHRVT